MNSRTRIAHLCSRYLSATETFIHFYLTAFRRTEPLVVSRFQPVNLDMFPPPAGLHALEAPRYSPDRIGRALMRRLTGYEAGENLYRQRCIKALHSSGARVIHAHFGAMGIWSLPLRREIGVPLVTTFYGIDTVPDPENPRWHEDMRELFEEGDLFLVEGDFMRRKLISLGCPPKKAAVQRIALRVASIEVPRRPRLDGRIPVLLFAGRFIEKKGLQYALEAVRILVANGHRFEFRIIGGGALEGELRSYVAEHRLDRCVRFLGFLKHTQYLEQMRAADIFVHPSVTAANGDNEGGAPTTILEAQAMGMPVVATTHADIPNVTLNGETALLTPERDSEALALALVELLDNPARWEEMGRAGRSFIEQNHDAAKEAPALERRYLRLIGK